MTSLTSGNVPLCDASGHGSVNQICLHYSNKQKTAKNARHEAEKALMEERRYVGITTGKYQGRGQGESGSADPGVDSTEDLASDDDDEDEEQTQTTSSTVPLLFFFDIETTGLSCYSDVIIDIGAKVIDVAVPQTYQSLVRTSKTIPEKGTATFEILLSF